MLSSWVATKADTNVSEKHAASFFRDKDEDGITAKKYNTDFTDSEMRVFKHLSLAIPIQNGLKQGNDFQLFKMNIVVTDRHFI